MSGSTRKSILVRVVALAGLAVLTGGVVLLSAPQVDAGWGGAGRSDYASIFNDIRICPDGIEYQLGTTYSGASELGFVRESIQIRLAGGAVVLDEEKGQTAWTGPPPPGFPPEWENLQFALGTYTDGWIGGRRLEVGTQINVILKSGDQVGPLDPPRVVGDCASGGGWGQSDSSVGSGYRPYVNDIEICPDGIEYQIGSIQNHLPYEARPAEPIQIRLADGTVVLDEVKSGLALWTGQAPPGSPPYLQPGSYTLGTFSDPWIVGRLPVGTQVDVFLEGSPNADPAIPPSQIPWLQVGPFDPPRSVTDCGEPASPDQVSVDVGGHSPYSNSGELTDGDFVVTAEGSGAAAVKGSGTIAGLSGGAATVAVDVRRPLSRKSAAFGKIEVSDPGWGVARRGAFVGTLSVEDGTATGRGHLVGWRGFVPITFTVVDAATPDG